MKIDKKLIIAYEKANNDIKSYVDDIVKKGDILIWKEGEYKGRRAEVQRAYWNDWSNEIEVLVRTYDRFNRNLMNESKYSHYLSEFNIKEFLFKKELERIRREKL